MPTSAHHLVRGAALAAALLALAAVASGGGAIGASAAAPRGARALSSSSAATASATPVGVRTIRISYRTHTGRARDAWVLVPRSYDVHGSRRLPLVISPHGRGTTGKANSKLWGNLPALGGFAVVNPDGQGNHLGAFSWGARGQIDDLARMPQLVEAALPWLRIDRTRVYAFGGSMGGQETLLLVARHPHLLAGAAAFDSLVDFGHQYDQFTRLHCNAICRGNWGGPLGRVLQALARKEVGGSPVTNRRGFARRSPLSHARSIASSGVPLQIWWSSEDRIVVDPERQSALLLRRIRGLSPAAPVVGVEGTWAHTHEMRATAEMPYALARFGLLPARFADVPSGDGLQLDEGA